MSRLLYIESSPRKKRSSSIEVARTFLEAYRQHHPDDEIELLDLWQKEIPIFDGDVIDAKYAILHGQSHTEAQRKSWRSVEQMIANFKRADRYLFSLPMWNFTIPYKLKHFFDVIVQPTYTFTFSPEEGYIGLVTDKPAVMIYSRGGAYGSGTEYEAFDFQRTYMETILKFIGITNIQSVVIEPTLESVEKKENAVKKAKDDAVKIANQI